MKGRLAGGHDMILLVYPETGRSMMLSGRARQLESLFTKAGLLK
jgi:predicted ATPase with chaperone activity